MLSDSSPEALAQPVIKASFMYEPAIAFVRDEQPFGDFVMMTPSAVSAFVDNHVHVFMQHGFSQGSSFSDMDYADVGVEFVDDFFQLSRMARVLVKFEPFTAEQVRLMREGQVLVSYMTLSSLSMSILLGFQEKKISALGLNLIKDLQGRGLTDRILTETLSPIAISIALSDFLLPLLMSLVCSPRLRFVLQRSAQWMESTYCFEGKICHKEIAEVFHFPLHDIISLCWDLN